RRIGARAVQISAAGAVDGAGVIAVERQDVARAAGEVVQIDMREGLPAAAQADHLSADLARSIDHRLDDGIQTGNIASPGQNTDAFCRQRVLLMGVGIRSIIRRHGARSVHVVRNSNCCDLVMAATVWKGYISFGLVSIPVRLYSGARGKTI